jgi:lycopene cyclase domain-containing protein
LKEYTLLALISVFFTVFLDVFLKTKLLKNKKFWIFWAIMFVITIIINGYLTYRPIVLYKEQFNSGIKLFTIPIEDFLFGFSLLSSNIIIWEFLTKKYNTK